MGIFPCHGSFVLGLLWHWEISAQGYFGPWTFWHRGTRTEMSVLKCLYSLSAKIVHMLKYHCAEMSCAVPQRPCAKTSMVPKYTHVEIFSCQNFLMPKSLVMKCPLQNVFSCTYFLSTLMWFLGQSFSTDKRG